MCVFVAPPPQPVQSRELPASAVKVLPKDAPKPMTDAERQQSADSQNYDRYMR